MLLACPRSSVDEIIVGELNSNGSTRRIVKLVLLNDALLIAPKFGSGSRKASSSSTFKFEALLTLSSLFIMDTPEKSPEYSFHLWISEAPVVFQPQSQEQRTRWLDNLRAVISRTSLLPETQSQINRHLSQSRSSSRLSFSLKKRSASLSSQSGGNTSPNRLSVTSFDSLGMKSSSSRASLREERLEDVLRDPVGLEKFTTFLRGEFSEENVHFWRECEVYKQLQPGEFHDAALTIVEKYIVTGAPQEVNLRHKTKEALFERVARNEFDDTLFGEVQSDIFNLMLTDPFPRFLKSELYNDYNRERFADRF